ncbi:MAG: SpoIIE family protein phosphatase [Nitrospirae bacterium]|nr:SpoIIE family protein phosphatase [Nitrospirota bacterium]
MLREKVPALCGRHNYCQSYYLDTVVEVSKAVGKEIQLEDILRVIIEQTAEVMEAERCTVFIYDESTNELWSYVAIGIEVNEIRFPLNAGIAGHVASTLKMANVPKAYDDPRFNCEFDIKTGYQTRSVLCFPMLNHEERLVGVLQVINKKSAVAFDRDDEILLEALSGHATAAIERAFLTKAYVEHKKNQDIMNMAREIQMSMLPRKFPTLSDDSNIDLYAFISPAKEVGGDFYDFFFIDDHLLCFAIGDVSDKGVPAALFMAVVKTLFRTHAKKDTSPLTGTGWTGVERRAPAKKDISPRQVLDNINKELCRDNEMMMFVTMFIGILDTLSGQFTYSNGGHNPPYIMFGNGRIKRLEASPGPAPGLIGEANYEEVTLMLNNGSTIFLYTDGVDEAKNNEGKMFSLTRLEELLCNISCSSLEEMTAKVVSTVTDFTAGASQSDDITLLSIKYYDIDNVKNNNRPISS